MCTGSWLFGDGGFELFLNRDETRLRARALAPRRCDADGVIYLAPEDGDAGGPPCSAVLGPPLTLMRQTARSPLLRHAVLAPRASPV